LEVPEAGLIARGITMAGSDGGALDRWGMPYLTLGDFEALTLTSSQSAEPSS